MKKFDSSCKNHSNIFCSYCINCQKNLCIICKKEHNNHKLIDLSIFDFPQKSKLKLENELKNFEKNIQQLEIIKQSIIIEINKSKELNKLQIRFIKLLLITHQYEKESNNLNFHFVQNIKNIEEMFNSNEFKNQFKKYNSLLQYLKNTNPNSIENNFKKINLNINEDHWNHKRRLIDLLNQD